MSVKQAAALSLLLGMIIFGVIFIAVRDIPADKDINDKLTARQKEKLEMSQKNMTVEKDGDTSLIWIETEYETYTSGIQMVRVKWYNKSAGQVTYGSGFRLEQWSDGKWTSYNDANRTNIAFSAIGYVLPTNSCGWSIYDLDIYTFGLQPGEYRIRTDYLLDDYKETRTNYIIYAPFTVGEETVKRNLTILDDTKIEYLNWYYGIRLMLPKSWEGYSVLTEQVTNASKANELYYAIDNEYITFKIRHPAWSEENPYQDIVYVVFILEEWNKNTLDVQNAYDINLPNGSSNGAYVVIRDIYSLNPDMLGYDDVSNF